MNKFTGPVFIVGMPRSGTKLLRDLLNQHKDISIPICESHFIPFLVRKYNLEEVQGNPENQARLIKDLFATSFFTELEQDGAAVDKQQLEKLLIDHSNFATWESILSIVLKYCSPKAFEEIKIWGDKTPGYINHLKLLKHIFSGAYFIHIIRDPRDYSLSVRNTWGKNLYRAAHRWQKGISQAMAVSKDFPKEYLEVHYEQLLNDPEPILRKICNFLECPFDPAITVLTKPSENYGDAKGKSFIMKSNKGKYLDQLNNRQIQRIEEAVYPSIKKMSSIYQIHYAKDYHPFSRIEMLFFKTYDSFASIRFHMKEQGFLYGIQYAMNHYFKSSWRSAQKTSYEEEG